MVVPPLGHLPLSPSRVWYLILMSKGSVANIMNINHIIINRIINQSKTLSGVAGLTKELLHPLERDKVSFPGAS